MNKRDEAVLESLSEYGSLHNVDCCVNYPEDSRACDVDTSVVDCCENMRTFSSFLLQKLQEERTSVLSLPCMQEEGIQKTAPETLKAFNEGKNYIRREIREAIIKSK